MYHPSLPLPRRGHALLRGGRWHLSRSRSRVLWTLATTSEIADLFSNATLQGEIEKFLRLASDAVDGIDGLMVCDERSADVAVVISRRSDRGQSCAWDWMVTSQR